MQRNEVARPRSVSWAVPVALLAAGAVGLWLSQAHGAPVLLGPAVGLLAAAAALAVVWVYRVRAARRRLFAALDVYAEKELARGRGRPHAPAMTGNRPPSRRGV